ncbi:MAG: T9SS type A sorting domain-containing protein [Saprospiraceae bacterium]
MKLFTAFLFLSLAICQLNSQNYFTPLNGPYGVRFSHVNFDSSGHLFAISDSLTMLRSSDLGDSWEDFGEGIELNLYWAKPPTTAPDGTVGIAVREKIYKLSEGQSKWDEVPFNAASNSLTRIAFNQDSKLLISNDNKVFKETGVNQFELIYELPDFYCTGMAFYGNDNNFIFGGIYNFGNSLILKITESGTIEEITPPQEVGYLYNIHYFKSGQLLVGSNFGLWNYDFLTQAWNSIDLNNIFNYYYTFDFVPVSDSAIYLINDFHVYFSDDNGQTFDKDTDSKYSIISENGKYLPKRIFPYNYYYAPWVLYTNSHTRSSEGVIVYANNYLSQSIMRSFDNGKNWERMDGQYKSADVFSTTKNSDGYLFTQSLDAYRVSRSTNDGLTWRPILLNANKIIKKLITHENEKSIYAIDRDNILYRSDNAGGTWDTIFTPQQTDYFYTLKLDISPEGNLFLTDNNLLFASYNKGNNWEFLDSMSFSSNISWHPDGSMYAFDGSKLFKSTDGGKNWEDADFEQPFSNGLSSLNISAQGHFLAQIDQPNTWPDIYGPPPYVTLNAIALAGAKKFVQLGGPVFLSPFLTSTFCGGILATNAGRNSLFLSIDNGENWETINTGLPAQMRINHVYVDKEQYIYVSLSNNVVYKSTVTACEIILPSAVSFESSNDLYLSKISPNPFSNSFKIEIENNYSQRLNFQLKNQNGLTVMEKDFWGNTLEVKRNNLPNGIYFYHIYLDEKIIAKGKIIAQ